MLSTEARRQEALALLVYLLLTYFSEGKGSISLGHDVKLNTTQTLHSFKGCDKQKWYRYTVMSLFEGRFSYLLLSKFLHSTEATQLLGEHISVLRKGKLRAQETGANTGTMSKPAKAVLLSIHLAFEHLWVCIILVSPIVSTPSL